MLFRLNKYLLNESGGSVVGLVFIYEPVIKNKIKIDFRFQQESEKPSDECLLFKTAKNLHFVIRNL